MNCSLRYGVVCAIKTETERKEGYSDNPDKSFCSSSLSLSLLIQSNIARGFLKIKINFLCYFYSLNKFLSSEAGGALVER